MADYRAEEEEEEKARRGERSDQGTRGLDKGTLGEQCNAKQVG